MKLSPETFMGDFIRLIKAGPAAICGFQFVSSPCHATKPSSLAELRYCPHKSKTTATSHIKKLRTLGTGTKAQFTVFATATRWRPQKEHRNKCSSEEQKCSLRTRTCMCISSDVCTEDNIIAGLSETKMLS